eukprot:PhF_6_TR8266/c0_g1_i2/m.12596
MINLSFSEIQRVQEILARGLSFQHTDELVEILAPVLGGIHAAQAWLRENHTLEDFGNAVLESAHVGHDNAARNDEFVSSKEISDGALVTSNMRSHKAELLTQLKYHARSDTYWSSSVHGLVTSWNPLSLKPTKTINNNVYSQKLKVSEVQLVTNRLLGKPPPQVRITDFDFLPSGVVVGVCTQDKMVNLYDTATGKHMKRFLGRTEKERELAALEKQNQIAVIGLEDPYLRGMEETPLSMIFTAAGSERDLALFGTSTGSIVGYHIPHSLQAIEIPQCVQLGQHKDVVSCMKYYRHNQEVYSCGWDGTLQVHDLMTNKTLRSWYDETRKPLMTFDLSEELTMLAAGGSERDVLVWNTSFVGPPARYPHNTPVISVAFNPKDNQLITVAEDEIIRIWDLRKGMVAQTLETGEALHLKESTQMMFFDKKSFRVVSASWKLKSWNIRRSQCQLPPKYEGHTFHPLFVGHVGNMQIITVDTHNAIIWDCSTGTKINAFQFPEAVQCCCLCLRRRRLFVVDVEGQFIVWNFRCGQQTHRYSFHVLRTSGVTRMEHVSAGYVLITKEKHIYGITDGFDTFTVRLAVVMEIPSGKGLCGCMLPSEAAVAPVRWVVGTTSSNIYVFSMNSGSLNITYPAVFNNTKLGIMSEDAIIGHMYGIKSKEGETVEDAIYISRLECVITVHGNQTIAFWTYPKNTWSLHYIYTTNFLPIESQRVLAVDGNDELLASGDDRGCIHIWSLQDVNIYEVMSRDRFTRVSSFRAFMNSIIRIEFVPESDLVAALSNELYCKIFTIGGQYVGYVGQSVPFSIQDPKKWKCNTRTSDPAYKATPREVTTNAQVKHAISEAVRIFGQNRIPNAEEMAQKLFRHTGYSLKKEGKRNSSRQVAGGSNNKGMFLTEVPTEDGQGDTSNKDHPTLGKSVLGKYLAPLVIDPREKDPTAITAISKIAQQRKGFSANTTTSQSNLLKPKLRRRGGGVTVVPLHPDLGDVLEDSDGDHRGGDKGHDEDDMKEIDNDNGDEADCSSVAGDTETASNVPQSRRYSTLSNPTSRKQLLGAERSRSLYIPKVKTIPEVIHELKTVNGALRKEAFSVKSYNAVIHKQDLFEDCTRDSDKGKIALKINAFRQLNPKSWTERSLTLLELQNIQNL